ncbi:unnamed protein product [Clonostachys rhizophaga]|uniref:Uncharacterized protein n=1 Tax=Clonostachys rhizophaga TaxID=160324 RepID=A0A9N9VAZ0_9HYPO|nr:unnamed protein product [Clonostachys rhizophaga]
MEDMSGCTGIFAWDKDHKLAAQHAFSGSEKNHVTNFAGELDKAKFTPDHVAIAADTGDKYKAAVDVLQEKYKLDPARQITRHHYENTPGNELGRHRFTAIFGDPNRHVKGEPYTAEPKEPGTPPEIL